LSIVRRIPTVKYLLEYAAHTLAGRQLMSGRPVKTQYVYSSGGQPTVRAGTS
jgi:hypothetical protein